MQQEFLFPKKEEKGFQHISEILPSYTEKLIKRAERPLDITQEHWNSLTEQEKQDVLFIYSLGNF